MRKLPIALLVVFVFGVCGAYAQDKYSVSGTVRCVGTADVLVSLSTHEEWVSDKEPVFCCAIKLTEEQKKAGKVSFKFEGVPEGRYATVNLFWFFVYAVVVFRLARIGRNEHLSCFGSWWKVFLGSLQARTSETPTCSCLQAYG